MRKGYTTGSCAAAATHGALNLLLRQKKLEKVNLLTPKGIRVEIPLTDHQMGMEVASCAAIKDSGDDPDVTDGALIYSKTRPIPGPLGHIEIIGGVGVGQVTKPGLACKVGEPAINPVPLEMIRKEAREVMEYYGYEGGIEVEISMPAGVELAAKTFNPKLGIVGGVSILGTTGIVEPMSEKALIDTIKVEIDVIEAAGHRNLVITPGNYGEKFIEKGTQITFDCVTKCSNYIGDTLDYAVTKKMESIVLVGHIGKLIKVAGGVFNTHSKEGDRRMELLCHYTEKAKGSQEIIANIDQCVTTEEAVNVLIEASMKDQVMALVIEDIEKQVRGRVGPNMNIGIVMYSNSHGLLGETDGAKAIIRAIVERGKNGELK